jgi:TatA/E family protein of Tat protein translocase
MGSLGLPELAFIFILALLIFGPKKLPEIGRTIGKGMAEFRKATSDLKRSINTELTLEENPVPQPLRPRRLDEAAQRREAGTLEPQAAPASTEPRTRVAPAPVSDPSENQ